MASKTRPKAAREERAPAIPAAAPDRAVPASLAAGAAYLKGELPRLYATTSVYRTIHRRGGPLYVGKARKLR